ncbi:MAG: mechanosensitive ion channel, partial [Deltaproteobacteria bacterium]|nr:mechanosensitive ion channel [Deltaproteobacteria bacterium]
MVNMAEFNILEFIRKVFGLTLFSIGQTPVTLTSLILFISFFIIFVLLSRWITKMLGSKVLSRLHIEEGTRYNFERVVYYTLVIIGAVLAFQFIGINLTGLAVIFGLLSVGIGFGLQNITSNFVAGLILLFERPVAVGDRVTVGDSEGDVVEINIRSTTIRTMNNIAIIVPNSEFVSEKVINWSHGEKKIRLDIDVGVSYNSDLDTVIRCMKEAADESDHVLKVPEPVVHLVTFGDSSWNMQLRCWIADPKQHPSIRSEINCEIVRKFRANNVEIPYPQHDLHVRSSIPLSI